MNRFNVRMAGSLFIAAQLLLPWQMTFAINGSADVVPSGGQSVVQIPKLGSPERTALLDCLRYRHDLKDLAVEWNIKKIIFFNVTNFVKDDWAYVSACPGTPDGKKQREPVSAVLHRVDGEWTFVDYISDDIASADNPNAAFKKWCNHFVKDHKSCPPEIFPTAFDAPASRQPKFVARTTTTTTTVHSSDPTLPTLNTLPMMTSSPTPATSPTPTSVSSAPALNPPALHPPNPADGLKAKPFFEAVKANFSAWDANGDGTLDRTELEIAAQNPKYTGDTAVALAVLKNSADSNFRSNKTVTFKVADIDELSGKAEAGEKLDPDYGRSFVVTSRKLKSQPKQLFTGSLPHIFAIHQGSTMDCYFLSSIGGLIESNPRSIVDMIQLSPDGSYAVTFPGTPPQKIPVPTETEMAAYSDAKDGYWLNILEKAYGNVRRLKPDQYTSEPMDTMALYGGSCAEVIKLITGHKVHTIQFQRKDPKAPSADVLTATVRQALAEAFSKHEIITASKVHHAYTVTEYDATADTVIVHNPYGNNGFEQWPDGTKGPRLVNGYFTVPVTDFVKYFRGMSHEVL